MLHENMVRLATWWARRGVRFRGLSFEENPDREFPDLLVFITVDGAEGERVYRSNYSVEGHWADAGDTALDLFQWGAENSRNYYRRLPLSGRESYP